MNPFQDKYSIYFENDFEIPKVSKVKCIISVLLNELKTCYILEYRWIVISGNEKIALNEAFPFIHKNEEDYDIDGVIISKNDMTTQMIRHVIMEDTELQKVCGLGTTTNYRKSIIHCLASLWD
jgi:hypothetical protein